MDGFFGDDVVHLASLVERIGELDREAIRESAIDRFSANRMVEAYESLMLRLVTGEASGDPRGGRPQLSVAASRTLARAGLASPPVHAPSTPESQLEESVDENPPKELGWGPGEGSAARLP